MDDKAIDLEKVSLKKLVEMLSVGQLWKVIGAIIFVIVGAFGFGAWVTEEFLLKPTSQKLQELDKENKQFAQQIKFLEQSLSYLNARVKNKEGHLNDSGEDVVLARKVFVNMLKEMYKGGNPNLQRNEGYVFDESEAGNHKIVFLNGKSYRVPRDIKGDFIDQLR